MVFDVETNSAMRGLKYVAAFGSLAYQAIPTEKLGLTRPPSD